MVKDKVTIKNLKGLHMRPAGVFCTEALKFKASVTVRKENTSVNGKSILGVLSAGVKENDEIEILCEGEDEIEALETLTRIVNDGLGE